LKESLIIISFLQTLLIISTELRWLPTKGKIILNNGYGFSNIMTKRANTSDTRFPILSVGKTFTATVILKLQEEGNLSINDKLSKYLPDYPQGDKIKIEYLLTHTSGIHNYTDDVGIEDSAIINHPVSKQRVLDQFWNKPLEFKPGTRYSYNNSGYFLLGLVIEKITGKPYETVGERNDFHSAWNEPLRIRFSQLTRFLKSNGISVLE
jgi:CubicO group peptidase (beta-lactamase class C family)